MLRIILCMYVYIYIYMFLSPMIMGISWWYNFGEDIFGVMEQSHFFATPRIQTLESQLPLGGECDLVEQLLGFLGYTWIYHDWLVGQGHPSEKYDFVNWDDDIPNINGKIKFMATSHHQPDGYTIIIPGPCSAKNFRCDASSCVFSGDSSRVEPRLAEAEAKVGPA